MLTWTGEDTHAEGGRAGEAGRQTLKLHSLERWHFKTQGRSAIGPMGNYLWDRLSEDQVAPTRVW